MTKSKYFNFPIQLLQGFLINSNDCLLNIKDYGVLKFAKTIKNGDELHKFESSLIHFNLDYDDINIEYDRCLSLYDSIPDKSPMVGISMLIYQDFFTNNKTEYEKVVLLAYLALKSIAQKKQYCKVTNFYWLARMAGYPTSINDKDELPHKLVRYTTEYQLKKIKDDLVLEWHLTMYSRYTRGFYVSFKFKLKELIKAVETVRRSNKLKSQKQIEKLLLEQVMEELK